VTDIVLLKFDTNGGQLWVRNWHGGFGTDWPVGLALDPHGNVDVVGNTINISPGTNFDWVVLEYDPAGNLLWTRKLAGALLAPDYSKGMAVAPNGDVVATGYLGQTTGNQHHTTACWSDDGTPLWSHVFPGPTGGGQTVAFDSLGRAYVAGQQGLVAYDGVGNLRWQQSFVVPGAAWTVPAFVARLPAERVALAGSAYFSGPGHEYALEVFDVSGASQDLLVIGPPDVGAPSDFAVRGSDLFLHGSGTNGHDQDMLTAALSVH